MQHLLLVINTGSTSTKLAVYRDAEQIHTTSLHHSTEDLAPFATIVEQKGFRQQVIVEWLEEIGVELADLTAIVARAACSRPFPEAPTASTSSWCATWPRSATEGTPLTWRG